MSGDITVSRSRTWHFSHTLYTSLKPEAARRCVQQAQLIHGTLSNVCSMIFSSKALKPSSTSICESPVRRSIIVSYAGGLFPLCQIFHFRASFRAHLPFAKQFCKHGWTPSGLPSVLNCVLIHNTGKNSWNLPIPRSCIFLFAGCLPSGRAEEGEDSPRV